MKKCWFVLLSFQKYLDPPVRSVERDCGSLWGLDGIWKVWSGRDGCLEWIRDGGSALLPNGRRQWVVEDAANCISAEEGHRWTAAVASPPVRRLHNCAPVESPFSICATLEGASNLIALPHSLRRPPISIQPADQQQKLLSNAVRLPGLNYPSAPTRTGAMVFLVFRRYCWDVLLIQTSTSAPRLATVFGNDAFGIAQLYIILGKRWRYFWTSGWSKFACCRKSKIGRIAVYIAAANFSTQFEDIF